MPEEAARMSWTWRYEPDSPDALAPGTFTSQSDAESWLGESHQKLAESGVVSVTLEHDGEKVYLMPLTE
jgi:hypothetical protein